MSASRGRTPMLDTLETLFQDVVARHDRKERLPSYLLLQKALQAGIEQGHWKTGDRIPPERLLADMSGLSVGTVKKAMLNLVSEGLLYRVRGRGTFVSGSSVARENRRYYLMLPDFDAPESDFSIRFAGLRQVRAGARAARLLGLSRGAACYELGRVFHEGGRPVVYTTSLLPKTLFPKLEAIPVNRLEKIPLFLILEETYSTPTIRTDELIGVAPADPEQAEQLRVEPGRPLLRIESVVFTYGKHPFEFRSTVCLADKKMIYRSM